MLVPLRVQKSQSKDTNKHHSLLQTSAFIAEDPEGNAGSFIKKVGSLLGSLCRFSDLFESMVNFGFYSRELQAHCAILIPAASQTPKAVAGEISVQAVVRTLQSIYVHEDSVT